jgi:2-iminobutanoate/2-iminopropanoate deaminase
MSKTVIHTANAPAPIGPYSQAIVANGVLYTSGQIAIVPESGALLIEEIRAETEQVMENVKAVVEAAGYTLNDVVKASIFLSNMDDFPLVNEVYGRYFSGEAPPARETVQVARLPKSVNVEISVIAVKSSKIV